MALSKITTASLADDSVTGAKIENNPTIAGNLTVNGSFAPSKNTSNKNMLINGDMRVSQRNGTSALTVSASAGAYTLDRWLLYTGSGNYSVQQVSESTLPDGFANACKITVSSVGSTSSASNVAFIEQKIEGYNINSLNWGGGNASTPATCTLSFWVKSSVTGTYSVHFGNDSDRFYVSTYTISSANTWEKKSITVTGPTDGTWNYTNGRGLEIAFPFVAGSNNTTSTLNSWITTEDYMSTSSVQWGTNAGATFYLTGCQFEISSIATPFEHENYTESLARCQRYYYKLGSTNGSAWTKFGGGMIRTTGDAVALIQNPVEMRAVPSIGTTGTASNYGLFHANTTTASSAVPVLDPQSTQKMTSLNCAASSGLTAGRGMILVAYNSTAIYLDFSAEL